MWFKNLRLYRYLRSFTLSAEDLAMKLQSLEFKPCGPQMESSRGFVAPLGGEDDLLVHATNGFLMVTLCREEKMLPASTVKDAAKERIDALEAERGLKLARRERDRIHDDVRFELLPRAFTREKRTFGYIDPIEGWLLVNASSDGQADQFTDALHEALGELPIALPQTKDRPSGVMTAWLNDGRAAEDFEAEHECEMRLPGEGGATVKCTNHDLWSQEIQVHLDHGKEVLKLGLVFQERIRFVLDDKLNIRRLRFMELVQDRADDVETDSIAARFDADFAVMSLELRDFVKGLLGAFGGEDREAMGVEA